MTLMMEATRVIELRLRLIVLGRSTPDEIFLMVTEKIDALEQATSVIIRGGDPSLIIDNYRKTVAANVARLSSAGGLPRALSGVRSDVQVKQVQLQQLQLPSRKSNFLLPAVTAIHH